MVLVFVLLRVCVFDIIPFTIYDNTSGHILAQLHCLGNNSSLSNATPSSHRPQSSWNSFAQTILLLSSHPHQTERNINSLGESMPSTLKAQTDSFIAYVCHAIAIIIYTQVHSAILRCRTSVQHIACVNEKRSRLLISSDGLLKKSFDVLVNEVLVIERC